MILIDTARAEELYGLMEPGTEVSGGSAANTMVGIASLGGSAAFVGKVADDQLGQVFAHDLIAAGVAFTAQPAKNNLPTGRCLVLVSPDGERTMNTYLGAAGLLRASDIDEAQVAAAKIIYLEGYRFDLPETKQAFYRAAEIAGKAGRQLAFSLSDRFCVEGHRPEFKRLIDEHCDLVFANESEVQALYETEDFNSAAQQLANAVEISCITRGAKGSIICAKGEVIEIGSAPVDRVIDTTGAGDLYAAGFLYGYTRGLALGECGRIAALAAGEVISHIGPRPQVKLA